MSARKEDYEKSLNHENEDVTDERQNNKPQNTIDPDNVSAVTKMEPPVQSFKSPRMSVTTATGSGLAKNSKRRLSGTRVSKESSKSSVTTTQTSNNNGNLQVRISMVWGILCEKL